jgi:hypothetical protein
VALPQQAVQIQDPAVLVHHHLLQVPLLHMPVVVVVAQRKRVQGQGRGVLAVAATEVAQAV